MRVMRSRLPYWRVDMGIDTKYHYRILFKNEKVVNHCYYMETELLNPILAFRGLSDEDQEEEVEIADDTEKEVDDDDDADDKDDDKDGDDDDVLVTEE